MKILTTGVSSGFGRYVHENLGGLGLSRESISRCLNEAMSTGVDVIIHSAFDSDMEVDSNEIYEYFNDNVLLTQELVRIPHKKFVFISTADVYPKDLNAHTEEEVLKVGHAKGGMRGITKLISESIVKKFCGDYIILRPATLLGLYSRKNTIIRMIENHECSVGLSRDSVYNCVLHEDVLEFINLSIRKDLHGIYNVASAKNIAISEIDNILGGKVKFGSYQYKIGEISNSKIVSIFPMFRKTSLEVVNSFIRMKKLKEVQCARQA